MSTQILRKMAYGITTIGVLIMCKHTPSIFPKLTTDTITPISSYLIANKKPSSPSKHFIDVLEDPNQRYVVFGLI